MIRKWGTGKMKKEIAFLSIIGFLSVMTVFAEETVRGAYCMSAIGYTGSESELKSELLVNAKVKAFDELAKEAIRSMPEGANLNIKGSLGSVFLVDFVELLDEPEYRNGNDFGEVCVTIHAHIPEAFKAKLKPEKLTGKACVSNPDMMQKDFGLTPSQLVENTHEKAVVFALLEREEGLSGKDKNHLMSLVHAVKYTEIGDTEGTRPYCVEFEGYIYPFEIQTLISSD